MWDPLGAIVARAPRRAYLIFLRLVGIAGLLGLIPSLLFHLQTPHVAVILAFCALGSAARLLAFPVYRGRVSAFDSAFFVTAGVVLGWETGAIVVVVTMIADQFWQRFRGAFFAGQDLTSSERRAQALFSIFGNAMLLVLVGHALAAVGLSPELSTRHRAVFLITPLALLAFVLGHYLLVFAAALLNGDRVASALSRLLILGVVGEGLLTPIAMVMVLVYEVHDPAPFALLALTVLVVNVGFFIAARYSSLLHERVTELSQLNQIIHAMAHSLETEPLLGALATQLFKHFANTEAVLLCVLEPTELGMGCYLVSKPGAALETYELERHPLVQKALKANQARRDCVSLGPDDPLSQALDFSRFCFLATSLQVYEGSIGAMILIRSGEQGFADKAQGRLQHLSTQVAFAVENARLFRLATVDGLTGLYVRRYFDQRLIDECRRAQRFGNPFSVLMMDLDDFKSINDLYGHALGDQVLRGTAEAIRQSLRAVDIAARYGGEEFVVVLPRTDQDEAAQVAERIRSSVAEKTYLHSKGHLSITLSIGVATYGTHGENADGLMRIADIALYQAKAAGKNQVAGAPASPDPQSMQQPDVVAS